MFHRHCFHLFIYPCFKHLSKSVTNRYTKHESFTNYLVTIVAGAYALQPTFSCGYLLISHFHSGVNLKVVSNSYEHHGGDIRSWIHVGIQCSTTSDLLATECWRTFHDLSQRFYFSGLTLLRSVTLCIVWGMYRHISSCTSSQSQYRDTYCIEATR